MEYNQLNKSDCTPIFAQNYQIEWCVSKTVHLSARSQSGELQGFRCSANIKFLISSPSNPPSSGSIIKIGKKFITHSKNLWVWERYWGSLFLCMRGSKTILKVQKPLLWRSTWRNSPTDHSWLNVGTKWGQALKVIPRRGKFKISNTNRWKWTNPTRWLARGPNRLESKSNRTLW